MDKTELARRLSVVVLSALVGLACGSSEVPPQGPREWSVDEEPHLEIRSMDGDAGPILFDILGVRRLSNGALLVGNGGSESLLMFDSLGAFLIEIGRPGGGPDEFQNLLGFDSCRGDTLVAWDIARVSTFDSGGRVQRLAARPSPEGGAIREIAAAAADCSSLLVIDQYPQPSSSLKIPQSDLGVADSPITLRSPLHAPLRSPPSEPPR